MGEKVTITVSPSVMKVFASARLTLAHFRR